MTAENENKICGMQKKSRIALGCAVMCSESQVCGMCKKRELSRVELRCAIITFESESKISGVDKRRRMESGFE